MTSPGMPGQNRWVVFDWGCVISLWTDALGELAELLNVEQERFEAAYWAQRQAYDTGASDLAYWSGVAALLGVEVDEPLVGKLVEVDMHGWLRTNTGTVALIDELAAAGVPLAVLSNAACSFGRLVEDQPWAQRFAVLLFSGDLGLAKPDPAIYTELLRRLATPPESCLFIDDRQDNVLAAREAGLQAVRFTEPETLRADLLQHGYLP